MTSNKKLLNSRNMVTICQTSTTINSIVIGSNSTSKFLTSIKNYRISLIQISLVSVTSNILLNCLRNSKIPSNVRLSVTTSVPNITVFSTIMLLSSTIFKEFSEKIKLKPLLLYVTCHSRSEKLFGSDIYSRK